MKTEDIDFMYNVKLYIANEFDKLSPFWKQLESGNDMTAFQSYSWYKLLNEQYLKNGIAIPGKCVYAVCFEDDKVRMIAPLYIVKLPLILKKIHIESGAYILGKWGYTDYLNFIYNDFSEHCVEEIMKEIKNKYNIDAFHFHQILPDTQMCKYLDGAYSDMFLFEGDCVKIPVKENFESYHKSLSKSVRQNLRTAQNRANKDNIDIHYEIIKNISDENAEKLNSIYCERQSIKKSEQNNLIENISSIFFNRKRNKYNFLIEMMKNQENGFVLGCFSGQEIIGMVCGAEDKAGIRIPAVCFKQDYARYSPCMLCIYNYIKDSYENGTIKVFDLLKGTETYKFQLSGERFAIKYYCVKI